MILLAMSAHSGKRLAEVGFLLILVAGAWMVATGLPQVRVAKGLRTVSGLALGVGALLLIVAVHWGHFG
jgi:hypothetical protein